MTDGIASGYPARFGFLLLNNFTLISMASAIEPLRVANRLSGKSQYSWTTVSETGGSVTASDGLSVNVDASINDKSVISDNDAIIVCGGARVENQVTNSIKRWLRYANQHGLGLGAVCTGSYVLAAAGLLDGYRCSVHWENIGVLAGEFPDIDVSHSVYTIDRGRFTSSGGTAPVDMMLHFVEERAGTEISAGVAEQLIYERIRQSSDNQRMPLRHRIGSQSEKLVAAVELMEANVKEPISQDELASYIGVSRRQLQRLFHRYLNCTPSKYYLQIRLTLARELLRQTSMKLVEVSASTGFFSSSQFSKSYRMFYGLSPSSERRIALGGGKPTDIRLSL